MLALLDFEGSTCSGCGGYLPDTTAPDASYVANPPIRCFRCDVIETKQADYHDSKNPGALRVWSVQTKN